MAIEYTVTEIKTEIGPYKVKGFLQSDRGGPHSEGPEDHWYFRVGHKWSDLRAGQSPPLYLHAEEGESLENALERLVAHLEEQDDGEAEAA